MTDRVRIAMITEVFFGDGGERRLRERLAEARADGAVLAVLPELPLDPWYPASGTPRDDGAEAPGGPRQRVQSAAAREAGIGVAGGAIVRDPSTGRRFNTAFVFDREGRQVLDYRKAHLPEEPGFWETAHYEPGDEPPAPAECVGLRVGVQICSDVNRPEGSHVLGALGTDVILAPRSTPLGSYERWKLVLRANAATSAAYVISVNRPGPEAGVPIGGPSVAIGPDGEVALETTEPLSVVDLEADELRRARAGYPGYLPVRASLYSRAWRDVAGAVEGRGS